MVGHFLAHYEILEPLGAGGMGEVYRARDTKLKREVALKILAPGLAASPLRRQRFEREARAVAALDHPNIVTVYSIDVADGGDGEKTPFITMQLVRGRTLRELLRGGGLLLDRFFDIAIALAGESIFLLDLVTGVMRPLTEPPSGSLGDKTPAFSPDGRTLAFARWFEAPRSEVWTVPVGGGPAKRELEFAGFIRGLDWLGAGPDILLSTWSADAPGLSRLRTGGVLTQLLVAEDAWGVSAAGEEGLVYSKRLSRSNIWRVSGPSALKPSPPQRLIGSTRDDWAPQYSPDGRRIAITSDRAGMPQTWICNEQGGDCARKETAGPAIMPRWSPDGLSLATAASRCRPTVAGFFTRSGRVQAPI